jgi:hypothetical protein
MSDEAAPKPIDFSALDPARNQVRWERSIQALVARGYAERRRRYVLEQELLRWARPVLAVAAALCLIVWTAGYLRGTRAAIPARSSALPPALTLATWAANDRIPDSNELFGTLGGNQ